MQNLHLLDVNHVSISHDERFFRLAEAYQRFSFPGAVSSGARQFFKGRCQLLHLKSVHVSSFHASPYCFIHYIMQ
jgi:hypothetical protein